MRTNAITKENMSAYFSLLAETLKEHNLLNKPSFIFNMDESGMPLDHKQPKIVATKGMKKVHGPASGDKTQIDVRMLLGIRFLQWLFLITNDLWGKSLVHCMV